MGERFFLPNNLLISVLELGTDMNDEQVHLLTGRFLILAISELC
jgi:hypothetical protein